MGDWSHNLIDVLNEKEKRKIKEILWELWRSNLSPRNLKNAIIKFYIRLSVAKRIQNLVPLPNPVLTHKSYVNKYLMNSTSKDRNRYLGNLQDA